ncbi:MAG: SWIM zinc finger family protein [Deltaproteobacteria bacterium]|nr:SWIM zinc finger family protein [Deltaproteobacteria bacterium]
MARYYDNFWPPYVPVAEKKAKAARKLAQLKKKGMNLNPVCLQGNKISNTFWGQSWCKNLEAYSDYSNRLPRGRSYLRQGAVLDLKMSEGKIAALVQGSALYEIEISITAMPAAQWKLLVDQCSGQIDSLIELLQGKLSKPVMQVMTQAQTGLFPHPKQIKLSCSCPDWADMCKHVAAVLYGAAIRLDEKPELLFTLRKVSQKDLITQMDVKKNIQTSSDDSFDTGELENIFGIDLGSKAEPEKKPEKNSDRKIKKKSIKAIRVKAKAKKKTKRRL